MLRRKLNSSTDSINKATNETSSRDTEYKKERENNGETNIISGMVGKLSGLLFFFTNQ